MRILWLPEALTDLERLYDFVVERDAAAAERTIRTIAEGADRLSTFPEGRLGAYHKKTIFYSER